MRKLHPTYYVSFLSIILLCSATAAFTQEVSLSTLKNYISARQEKFGLSAADVETVAITYNYTDATTGINHIYSTQKLNGLAITGSHFSLHTSGMSKAESNGLVPISKYRTQPVSVSIQSDRAVANVMAAVSYPAGSGPSIKQASSGTDRYTVYKRNNSSLWDIPCRLVYFNDSKLKSLVPAWEVQMLDVNKTHYWLVYVDAASGKILQKKDLIIHCKFDGVPTDEWLSSVDVKENASTHNSSQLAELNELQAPSAIPANSYRVYKLPYESPMDPGATHSISTRSGDTLSSPDGWHKVGNLITYNYSRGNNAWAFQDPSPGPLGGVPSADPTRTAYPTNTTLGVYPVTEPFVFDYPVNLANEPETYMKGAIVNLFYWNNLMHDVFYYMGFDEASANFQESNSFSVGSRGGTDALANDAILAQAQDGGGTNNANFLTLPDGTNGQMQMYLWTAASPDSLVQIVSSTSGTPKANAKFLAVQGSFNTLPVSTANLYTNPVLNKQLALIKKNALSTVGTDTEGCSTGQQSIALSANNVNGKIAVIDRGNCSFAEKILGAQLGGAVGVIVINNVDGAPQAMGGADAPANGITIPAVMISKADGAILKTQLIAGATITGSLKRNTPPAPKRDGDFDNGVIAHEYGHGISNRLTGGGSALLPLGGDEQGGEGWSDFVALYMTMRTTDLTAATTEHAKGVLPSRSIGNYVTYQKFDGRGIREYPYSVDLAVNPATFSYIKRPDYAETHSVGFVWCSMLYEVLQGFIDKYGMNNEIYEGARPTASRNPAATAKGNNIATRLIVEAMKLQPQAPTFIEERDAILKADTLLYNGQHACLIWKAFAKRGLGFSASSGTNGLGDEFEAFDLPLSCAPNQKRIRVEKSGPIVLNNGSTITYNIKITNKLPIALTNVKVIDTLASSLTFVSSNVKVVRNGQRLTWTISLAKNAVTTIQVKATLQSTASSTLIFSDDHEANADKWTADASATAAWTYTTDSAQAYSGKKFWFVADYDIGGSNTSLKTKTAVAIPANAELVFIHKFATEDAYDGGVVEVSTDGINWTYIPPTAFRTGGYKGIIPVANNPTIGTADLAAFTGASNGYGLSIASLTDYAGKNIFIRFRMTADVTGGSVAGGGWWLDNVYILANRVDIKNRVKAITTDGQPVLEYEGTNAFSQTSGFIVKPGTTLTKAEVNKEEFVQTFSANLYPNPVTSIANLNIDNPDAEPITIMLYDVSGKKMATFNGGKTKKNNVQIPVQSLRSGTYWVEVRSLKQTITLRMVLNK